MKTKLILSFSVTLVLSGAAHAGSLRCSNAAQSLTYSYSKPDGGAHIGSTEHLKLGDQVLIKDEPFSEEKVHLASHRLVGRVLYEKTVAQGDYKTRTFVQKLVVESTDDPKELLFAKPVICDQRTYHGIPIP